MTERFEKWHEFPEDDPSFVLLAFDKGSPLFRTALVELARVAPQRLTYAELEQRLGWPRGRWRSVIGGYTQRSYRYYDQKRPFHICPPDISPRGEWECWMTQRAAEPLRQNERGGGD